LAAPGDVVGADALPFPVVSQQAAPLTSETLQAFVDAFNAHDLDRIMSFFSDDCVFESPRGPDPWGTRFTGPVEVRHGLAQRFAGIPDVRYSDAEHWVCGDHAVSTWLLTGTTTAGDSVSVRGCDLFDLAGDGTIRRKDSYWKIVT
jgi:ketosteroid isomerase-like protein